MKLTKIVKNPNSKWKQLLIYSGPVFLVVAAAIGLTYFIMTQQMNSDNNIANKKISDLSAQIARLETPGSSEAKKWCIQQVSDYEVEKIRLVYTESSSIRNMGYSFVSCDLQWPSREGAYFDGVNLIGRKLPGDAWSIIYKGPGFPSEKLIDQYSMPKEISGNIQSNS